MSMSTSRRSTACCNVDDFRSATRSAACGGTTTIVPFVQQEEGKGLRQSVKAYHGKADGNAVIDYAFHLMITDTGDQVLGQELPALVEDGCSSFKIYMTYEGMALDDLADPGGACDAASHRRDGDDPRRERSLHPLADQAARRGSGDSSLAQYPKMAPMPVEREATHRAITAGRRSSTCPILLVHVSAREALEQIKWGRDRGLEGLRRDLPANILFLDEETTSPRLGGRAPSICARRRRATKATPMHLWHWPRQRPVPGAVVRPLLFQVRGSEGRQEGARTAPAFPQGGAGRAGHRDAVAADVFREASARAASISMRFRRADRDQRGEDVRPLSAQGHDRRRRRCRHRHLGSGARRSPSATTSCTTTWTTRPMRA